jgi:hypothetical protein
MYRNSLIQVHGYVGKGPFHLKEKNGKRYVRFSVGVTNQISKEKTSTHWYSIMVYGVLAEALIRENRIKEGYECSAFGVHLFGQYLGKDNQKMFSNTVIADSVVMNASLFSDKAAQDLKKARVIDHTISDEDVVF